MRRRGRALGRTQARRGLALRRRYGHAEAHSPAEFDAALARFVAQAQAIIDDYYARNYPSQKAVLSTESGQRYVRIVRSDVGGVSRSVHCFVDKTSGDVLMAESWKRPAKHARGNIYAAVPIGAFMGPHGAAYLRKR